MYSYTGKAIHYLLRFNYWALFYKGIKNVHDAEMGIVKKRECSVKKSYLRFYYIWQHFTNRGRFLYSCSSQFPPEILTQCIQ